MMRNSTSTGCYGARAGWLLTAKGWAGSRTVEASVAVQEAAQTRPPRASYSGSLPLKLLSACLLSRTLSPWPAPC